MEDLGLEMLNSLCIMPTPTHSSTVQTCSMILRCERYPYLFRMFFVPFLSILLYKYLSIIKLTYLCIYRSYMPCLLISWYDIILYNTLLGGGALA